MKHYEQNHDYMRNKKNFARIASEEGNKSLQRQSERKIQNENKYGKYYDLLLLGQNDRISGTAPQTLDDEVKQISYSYGYFEKGSRVLEGKFAKGELSTEDQRNFGIADFIHSIPEKYLNNLKKYPAYLEGRIYQMGKSSYDFCAQNDLDFKIYVDTMAVLSPEVTTEIFKAGYEARQEEYLSQKRHK